MKTTAKRDPDAAPARSAPSNGKKPAPQPPATPANPPPRKGPPPKETVATPVGRPTYKRFSADDGCVVRQYDKCRLDFSDGSSAYVTRGSVVVVKYFVGDGDSDLATSHAVVRKIKRLPPPGEYDLDPGAEDDACEDEMQLSVSWAVTQKEVRADYPNWEPLGGDAPANERFYNVRWTDDIAPANIVEVTPCVFLTRRRTFTNRSVLPPPGGKKIFINKVMEVTRYKGKPPVVKMHQLDDDDFDANIRDHLEKLMNMPESAAANAAARAGAPEEEKASTKGRKKAAKDPDADTDATDVAPTDESDDDEPVHSPRRKKRRAAADATESSDDDDEEEEEEEEEEENVTAVGGFAVRKAAAASKLHAARAKGPPSSPVPLRSPARSAPPPLGSTFEDALAECAGVDLAAARKVMKAAASLDEQLRESFPDRDAYARKARALLTAIKANPFLGAEAAKEGKLTRERLEEFGLAPKKAAAT